MNEQLNQIIKNEKVLLVVVNNTVNDNSTAEEIKNATLAAWKMNFKKACMIDYVIGVRNGMGVSCYKVDSVGIRKSDQRVIFGASEDLCYVVEGFDFKAAEIRRGYKEIQYINIDKNVEEK